MRSALPILCALATLLPASAGAQVVFSRESAVPPVVQDFAWHALASHCDFQAYERSQRSFWAYRARAERIGGVAVYSIQIVSDVSWSKADPPAFVDMTIADDGGLRLTGLSSSFIRCAR